MARLVVCVCGVCFCFFGCASGPLGARSARLLVEKRRPGQEKAGQKAPCKAAFDRQPSRFGAESENKNRVMKKRDEEEEKIHRKTLSLGEVHGVLGVIVDLDGLGQRLRVPAVTLTRHVAALSAATTGRAQVRGKYTGSEVISTGNSCSF